MADSSLDYKSFFGIIGAVATAVAGLLLPAIKWLFNAREREHQQMLTALQDQFKECKSERDTLYTKLDTESERHHQQMLQAYQQHHEQMLAATRQYADAINKMLDENKKLLHQHTTSSAQLTEWMTDHAHKVEVLSEEIVDLKREVALALDKQAHPTS